MLLRTALIVILGIFNLALLSKAVWGPTGMLEYHALKEQLALLQQRIGDLDGENLALSREIRLLHSDKKYMEKMVRQRLHYLRDNEVVYIFANPNRKRMGANFDDGKN